MKKSSAHPEPCAARSGRRRTPVVFCLEPKGHAGPHKVFGRTWPQTKREEASAAAAPSAVPAIDELVPVSNESKRAHKMAVCIGYNELAKLATTLGEKMYYRLMRDTWVKAFVEIGGNANLFASEDGIVTFEVPGGPPHIVLHERDIEMMRSAVIVHDHVKHGGRNPQHAFARRCLTHDELVVACKNVGVDLTCGECAMIFYTGTGGHAHTCPLKDAPPLEITVVTSENGEVPR